MDRARKIVCLYLGQFPTICPKEKLQMAIPKLKMKKGIPETSPVKYCMPEKSMRCKSLCPNCEDDSRKGGKIVVHRCAVLSDLPKFVITACMSSCRRHCVIAMSASDLLDEVVQMKLSSASHLKCLVVANTVQHFFDQFSEKLPVQSDGQWH